MEATGQALTFVNLLFHKVLRFGHGTKQVGRLPHFFNEKEMVTIDEGGHLGRLEVWPGYKASSHIYNSGIFLVLESLNKIVRKLNCWDAIEAQLEINPDLGELDYYFSGMEIRTTWHKKKPYSIRRIRTDLTPLTHKFSVDGEQVAMLDYFRDRYEVKLDPTQPLVEVRTKTGEAFLPSEMCNVECVPEALKR